MLSVQATGIAVLIALGVGFFIGHFCGKISGNLEATEEFLRLSALRLRDIDATIIRAKASQDRSKVIPLKS